MNMLRRNETVATVANILREYYGEQLDINRQAVAQEIVKAVQALAQHDTNN